MTGTIIENISGRKLAILVSILMLCQVLCFIIGGYAADSPENVQNILATTYKGVSPTINGTTKWYYNKGKGASQGSDLLQLKSNLPDTNIVFGFQLPIPPARGYKNWYYSKWQQKMIGLLQVMTKYHSQMEILPRRIATIEARLAYRNKEDAEDEWKLYAQSIEKRQVDCTLFTKLEDYQFDCSAIPLFDLGSVHHDSYLLNIRLPFDKDMEPLIYHIADLWLDVEMQSGSFTKVWLFLKTVFFSSILVTLVWFWRCLNMLNREPVLLEKMLLCLGIFLSILNMPIEYLTLCYDFPAISILEDIRLSAFYVMLFVFWLVFVGEHMLINDCVKSSLKQYWKHLSMVAIWCIPPFVINVCERSLLLRNPFYSIWVTDLGANLGLALVILTGIFSGVYFIFLCYIVWQLFSNIESKQQTSLTKNLIRGLDYDENNYRFVFLMLSTLICAALTVARFIFGQVTDGHWKWHDNFQIPYTSAFFIGVYGMWNTYVFALLVLYAPSRQSGADVKWV